MQKRGEDKKNRLADEPRLAEVARGILRPLDSFLARDRDVPFAALPRFEGEAEEFAKAMRAVFGFERLPDPVSSWIVKLATGELALRRTLAVGKLELRRWEGELVLFRRPVGALRRTLDKILERPLLDELERVELDDGEIVEWACSGPFERLLAVREARSVLLRFVPRLEAETFTLAHERADDLVIERVRERARPPGPWARPAPLAMPPGGRVSPRSVVKKKRVKR